MEKIPPPPKKSNKLADIKSPLPLSHSQSALTQNENSPLPSAYRVHWADPQSPILTSSHSPATSTKRISPSPLTPLHLHCSIILSRLAISPPQPQTSPQKQRRSYFSNTLRPPPHRYPPPHQTSPSKQIIRRVSACKHEMKIKCKMYSISFKKYSTYIGFFLHIQR